MSSRGLKGAYAPDESQNSRFLLLMKKARTNAKNSLSLVLIKYSPPPPLLCIMPRGQNFLGGVEVLMALVLQFSL